MIDLAAAFYVFEKILNYVFIILFVVGFIGYAAYEIYWNKK